jgi:hypothetical protein
MDVIEQMAEHIGHRVSLIGGEDATDGLICETCGEYLIEWDDFGSTANDQRAVEALYAAIGEGCCAEGHAWTDGFNVHCESCERVRPLANRVIDSVSP